MKTFDIHDWRAKYLNKPSTINESQEPEGFDRLELGRTNSPDPKSRIFYGDDSSDEFELRVVSKRGISNIKYDDIELHDKLAADSGYKSEIDNWEFYEDLRSDDQEDAMNGHGGEVIQLTHPETGRPVKVVILDN